MIRVEARPSPEPSFPPSLADLSRNASVISSSSSSDSTSSLILNTPPRPRPNRQFSSPRTNNITQTIPKSNSKPPAYLTGGLGDDRANGTSSEAKRIAARARSQSRNRSVNGRISAEDFEFGEELGEGSYSTVRLHTSYYFLPRILTAHANRSRVRNIVQRAKSMLSRFWIKVI